MTKLKQNIPLLICFLLMTVLMVVCLQIQSQGRAENWLVFRDTKTGIELKPVYEEEEQTFRLYLPSHVLPEYVEIVEPAFGGWTVTLIDDDVQYRNQLTGVPVGKEINLTKRFLTKTLEYTLEIYQCENLPALYIDAEPGLLEYLHQDKKCQRDATVRMVGAHQEEILFDVVTITGRGNGTWENQPKRPYNLEFSSKVSFGPFESVKKVCLLAEYSDESKLRNSIAYHIGKLMDVPYASEYMYTDVFVNGEYLGLYGIVTKDNYKNRIQADSIQSVFEFLGYMNTEKADFWIPWTGTPVRVYQGNERNLLYTLDDFEIALRNKQWDVCAEYIDFASFAKKYVLEEFIANSDMIYASQYFYIDGTGKIKCMLPWDYDWSLGYSVTYYNNKQAQELKVYKSKNHWYALLMESAEFRQEVKSVIDTYLNDQLLDEIEIHMDMVQTQIEASRSCDQLRWEGERLFNNFEFMKETKSMQVYYQEYKQFFGDRRNFLKTYFSRPEDFFRIEFQSEHYGNIYVPRNTRLESVLSEASIMSVPHHVPGFEGWFTEEGLKPEDIGTVTENIMFFARYE